MCQTCGATTPDEHRRRAHKEGDTTSQVSMDADPKECVDCRELVLIEHSDYLAGEYLARWVYSVEDDGLRHRHLVVY